MCFTKSKKKYIFVNKGYFMLRQVIVPSKERSSFPFPIEYYGKEVEILVFPSNKNNKNTENLNNIFDKYLFSFANYKFDRDEANNYE